MSSKNIIAVNWAAVSEPETVAPVEVLSTSQHFAMAASCWFANAQALEQDGRAQEAQQALEMAYISERQMEQALLEEACRE